MTTPRALRRHVGPPLRFAVARWLGNESQHPFGSVFRFHLDRRTLVTATALAVLVYGGAIAAALLSPASVKVGPAPQREIPVIVAAPPPPSPAAPVPHEEPPPQAAPRQRRAVAAAPAQASKVLTRAESPEVPADFTNFAIATGEGNVYAGGYTSAKGTAKSAVLAPPAPRARGRAALPSQARQAEPARRDWSCSWPDEAQSMDLRETRVAVRVRVSPDGDPLSAEVQGASLPGFAEAAKRCALEESFKPALDPLGKRVAGETGLLVVHFVR